MSKLRSINTIIWSDPWFELLEPSAKLLFIYLVTNEKTNMLGVYEISTRKVSFETGIPSKDIERYLKEFEISKKIRYSENRVLLLNFLKHQNYNFNMMKSAIRTYNDLPESLKVVKLGVVEETKEGFITLCNGFAGVRKIEVEDEIELEDESEDSENPLPPFNPIKEIENNKHLLESPKEEFVVESHFAYLKENYASTFYQTYLKSNDFKKILGLTDSEQKKFKQRFDAACLTDDIKMDGKRIYGRLVGFTNSWVSNLKNNSKKGML